MRYLLLIAVLITLGPTAENTWNDARRLRPFPVWMAAVTTPLPADLTPADGTALASAITSAVGGDTITLTADGRKYTGPFTLAAGKASTVTIRSSAFASLPTPGAQRAVSSANLAIIECGASSNQKCISTPTNGAANYRFWGIEFQQKTGTVNQGAMIMIGDNTETNSAEVAENIEFSYCRLVPTVGTVRGFWLNGRNITVRDSETETFRTIGQENQAVLLAGGPGPFTIDNSHLRAVGEVFMSGGTGTGIFPGDLTFTHNYVEAPQKYNPWNLAAFDTADVEASASLPCTLSSTGSTATCTGHGVPADTFRVIKLTSGPQTGEMKTVGRVDNNTLNIYTPFTANQSSVSATAYTPFTGHKNNFELKYLHGTSNVVEGNVFDGCWVMGQDGVCLVITVRTESGTLPTATIKNAEIRYNYFKRMHSFVRVITPDDALPAGVGVDNVKIHDNVIELAYGNSGPGSQAGVPTDGVRFALINGVSVTLPANNLWLNHNTVRSTLQLNSYASLVGDCTPSCGDYTNFEFRDNLFAAESDFGIFGDGVEGTAALNSRMGAGNYNAQSNTLLNHTTTGYPTGTFSEASTTGFGFNDLANSDYNLSSGLYRAGQSRQATDGLDRGANVSTLSTKIGASTNAYATASINAVTGTWILATITAYQANLQHGEGTDTAFNFPRQITAMADADIMFVQERSTTETGWNVPMAAAGFVQAVYRENDANQADGPAIWYKASTVTVNAVYQTDLQTTNLIGWDGTTTVNKAAVGASVTVGGQQFYVFSTHLCWSQCNDSSSVTTSSKREGQIATFLTWVNTITSGSANVLIGGDMNFAPDTPKISGGFQKDLFTAAGYTDLWNAGITAGTATASWGDRNADSITDMPVSDLGTRTHDTRRIDYFFVKSGTTVLTMTGISVPDSRATCPHGLVAGGAMPSCSPEVVGGTGVSGQQWDIPDDFGVRTSDHNFVRTVLNVTASGVTICRWSTSPACQSQ